MCRVCLFVSCVVRQQLEWTRTPLKSSKSRKEKILTRRGPVEVCPLGIVRYQQKFSKYMGIRLVYWQWAGFGYAYTEGYRTGYGTEIIPCDKLSRTKRKYECLLLFIQTTLLQVWWKMWHCYRLSEYLEKQYIWFAKKINNGNLAIEYILRFTK